jgi:hypothetical protein
VRGRAPFDLSGSIYAERKMVAGGSNKTSPWASGPRELLRHGLELLRRGGEADRRLAMIVIDNAVELTIKTYLGLPKRVTGIHVPRAKYQEMAESFPRLLDGLEEYCLKQKLNGIDLGEVEWYHRLRNQLYHQGNGLTIEAERVSVYAELAKLLFFRLFDEELTVPETKDTEAIGSFMSNWAKVERGLIDYSEFVADTFGRTPNVLAAAKVLVEEGKLSEQLFNKFRLAQAARNKLVHGQGSSGELLTPEVLTALQALDNWLLTADKDYAKKKVGQ